MNGKDLRIVFAWWKAYRKAQNMDVGEKPAVEDKSTAEASKGAENEIKDELDKEEAELQEVDKMVAELEVCRFLLSLRQSFTFY